MKTGTAEARSRSTATSRSELSTRTSAHSLTLNDFMRTLRAVCCQHCGHLFLTPSRKTRYCCVLCGAHITSPLADYHCVLRVLCQRALSLQGLGDSVVRLGVVVHHTGIDYRLLLRAVELQIIKPYDYARCWTIWRGCWKCRGHVRPRP